MTGLHPPHALLCLFATYGALMCLGQAAWSLSVARGPVRTFYVATDGSDRWSGRLAKADRGGRDGPFATLARAQDAVRCALQQDGRPAIRVLVRGGRYQLPSPLTFDERDSGTRDRPVTWSAFGDERPILSGARRIADWRPYEGRILQADLGREAAKPHDLFLDGVRQVRARSPEHDPANPLYGGWAFMQGSAGPDGFRYATRLLDRPLRNPNQAEVFFIVGPNGGWGSQTLAVSGVDYARHIVHTVYGMGEHPLLGFGPNSRFIIENDLSLLSQAGEWCADTDARKVYFWPPRPLARNDQVTVPVLATILTLSRARWITIAGFTFAETTAGSRGGVVCEDSEHIAILRNRFMGAGGRALELFGRTRSCSGVTVRGNEIAHAGGSGIYCGGRVRDCLIADNDVHHCALFDKYSAGIEFPFYGGTAVDVSKDAFTDRVTITHNHVHDLPRDGIQLGANPWGRNVVAYTRVERTAQETVDAGAIRCHRAITHLHGVDSLPPMGGHVIRGNLIADTRGCGVANGVIVTPYPWPTFGIYLDEGSSNCVVQQNVVLRSGVGVIINPGERNTIQDNVLVDNRIGLFHQAAAPFPGANAPLVGNRFERNVISMSAPGDVAFRLHDWTASLLSVCDRNVFWNTHGPVAVETRAAPLAPTVRYSLTEWQGAGYDRRSRVAKPGFVGADRGDYRLLRGSPARALGCAPIDVRQTGIRPGWRLRPRLRGS